MGRYEYHGSMYESVVSRFCSRDPVGYAAGSNCLFEYCHDKPLKYIDPWGEQILPPTGPAYLITPSCRSLTVGGQPCNVANFDLWLRRELSDMSWVNKLPACPCSINCFQERWYYCRGRLTSYENKKWICDEPPPGFSWGGIGFWLSEFFWDYHGGGRYELRSMPGGTQCIYDAEGELMSTIPDAGSADRYPPPTGNHREGDVFPFDCARCLDEVHRTQNFVRKYYQARPLNSGKPCQGGPTILPPIGKRPS